MSEFKEDLEKDNKEQEEKELLESLKKKVSSAVKFYDDNKKEQYKQYVEYWNGNQGAALVRAFGACDKVIANICLARVETLIPNIISRNIQVSVNGEDISSRFLNHLVTNEIRSDRGYQELYYTARDYAMVGEGYVKTTWITDGELSTEEEQLTLDRDENDIKRISFERIFPDPKAQNFNDIKYICEKHCLTKDEIKERYSNIDLSTFKFGSSEVGGDEDELVIWEIYCLKKNRWIKYETDNGFKKIFVEEATKNGHPYDYCSNIKHPLKLLPQGEIKPIMPLQNELNKTLTQMSLTRESGGNKSIYNKGAITATQLNHANNSPANNYVEVTDIGGIQDRPMRFQANPFIACKELVMSLFQIVSGSSALILGGGASSGVTARSDMLADARFEGRESQKREDIEDLVRGVVNKLIFNFKNYLDIKKSINIDNKPAKISKEDLKADYDPSVVVRINTSGKVVRQAERDALRGLFVDMTSTGAFKPEEVREVFKRILGTFDEFDGLDKMIEDLEIIPVDVPPEMTQELPIEDTQTAIPMQ